MRVKTIRDNLQKIKSPKNRLIFFQSLIIPVALIVFWDVSVRWAWIPNTLIASPLQVALRFWEMLLSGEILEHLSVSLWRLTTGFAIGTLLGTTIGALVGYSKTLARFLEPTILTLCPVPPIAWIPILIILLGIDDASKIALIAIAGFFTLFIQTAYSIRTTDKKLVEVGLVFEKSRMEMLFQILLPSALPNILANIRLALAFSWTLLMASEIIASSKGMGWLIWHARNFSKSDEMIVGMIVIGISGKLTDLCVVLLEQRLTRWRRVYRDS